MWPSRLTRCRRTLCNLCNDIKILCLEVQSVGGSRWSGRNCKIRWWPLRQTWWWKKCFCQCSEATIQNTNQIRFKGHVDMFTRLFESNNGIGLYRSGDEGQWSKRGKLVRQIKSIHYYHYGYLPWSVGRSAYITNIFPLIRNFTIRTWLACW